MSSIWGNKLKVSVFGESHGSEIGVVIDGFLPGYEIDMDYINTQMSRRRPGNSSVSSNRKEEDRVEIVSGVLNGVTTGAPICGIIHNEDARSKDYETIKNTPRPGHSDFTAHMKYNGFNDYRGGGHFSGRLTAPLVFAGALCMSILEKKYGICIGSHIFCIHNAYDIALKNESMRSALCKKLSKMDFPVLSETKGNFMKEEIEKAKESLDSVGGVIETFVLKVPMGIGEPMFDSVESRLSHLLFSIPGVKGVEFGAGFNIASMYGSEANDEYISNGKKIYTKTNNNGGIVGGLTNGMPIVFRTAIKPTPSIGKEQATVDLETMENTKIKIVGRHDPCIVPRAIPAIEAATAIVVLDFLLNS